MAEVSPGRRAVGRLGGLLGWLGLAALVFLAVRMVRRWVDREVEDVNRRHALRKGARYTGGFVVLLAALLLVAGRIGQVATIVGLVGAGLAIALQDLGKSLAGWVFLTTRSGFGPGTRTEVDGIEGEVIDIGLLKTTVLEVGNLVHGRQSSGRLATVPNSKFLNATSFFSPSYAPYTWQEIRFLLTYESEWRRGVELLEEFAREKNRNSEEDVEGAFRELERRYAFKMGPHPDRVRDRGGLRHPAHPASPDPPARASRSARPDHALHDRSRRAGARPVLHLPHSTILPPR